MSERPVTPPGGDEFEAALRARRRLLPRFDADVDDEPSPELDRLVLSRAREALRREIPPERHYRSPRWAAPVAIAATVLLSLGLVLQMDPSRNDAVLGTAVDPTATTELAAPERAAAEPADAAAVSAPPLAAPRPAMPPAAPPPPAMPPAATPPAMTMRAAPAPTAQPAPAAAARLDSVADSATESVASAAGFADVPGADAAIPRDDPQRWLAAIEQLRVAGDVDAARRELAAFRRRHPDLPLPDDLDALR